MPRTRLALIAAGILVLGSSCQEVKDVFGIGPNRLRFVDVAALALAFLCIAAVTLIARATVQADR